MNEWLKDIKWKCMMNHDMYGFGSRKKELSAWLDTHINAFSDIMDAACGLKKILWKKEPVFIDISSNDETCKFQSGFTRKVIVDDVELNFINSCECGFESWSSLAVKQCPNCAQKTSVFNINAELEKIPQPYAECENCGHVNNNLKSDMCPNCTCNTMKIIKKELKKKVTYLNIFECPKEVDETFFDLLLDLMYAVELFINGFIGEENLKEQWQKLYIYILKRDKEMIAEGVGNSEAKQTVEQMLQYYE